MAERSTKGRLGDRLIDKGRLTDRQLEVALAEQKRAHRALGEILISLGFCRQDDIAELVAEDMGLPYLRGRDITVDPLVASTVDPDFVRETEAFPYALVDGTLKLVMVDPEDPDKRAQVRARFPYPLEIALTSEQTVLQLLKQHLETGIGLVAEIFAALHHAADEEIAALPIEDVTEAILLDGVHRGATDIHLEPEERVTRVRYRIDGVLQQGENLPVDATAAIVSRIKILSQLDISERRRPQDGRLRMKVNDRDVDMRVSIMPCTAGENVVLRVLAQSAGGLVLSDLGVAPALERVLERVVERAHGIFLVTGPTGSGKTTTLYAMLAKVDAMRRNVATIEDPVEIQVPLLRQSQVDTSIGFGFHAGLRSLLRQDPDVILVGEIRDRETADMAVKASMTGHLVLSTLHTNTALGAIPRLVDIGIEAFLIEDSLIGAMGQRLVRRVCDLCAEKVEASPLEAQWLGDGTETVLRGSGCERCNNTGLSGRTVMAEVFLPSDDMADAMRSGASLGTLERLAVESGFVSMEQEGKRLVRLGVTTMDEVMRVNSCHRLTSEEREDL